MKKLLYLLIFLLPFSLRSQETMNSSLPYYEIPEAPASYTAATVAARMIDGLGFRFYWVTDSLQAEDLSYKPSEDGRTTGETVEHIYGLTQTIYNTVHSIPNKKVEKEDLSFNEKRKRTLEMLYASSLILRENPDLVDLNIVFERNSAMTEYPFWNLINGPIADAIWHCGQIVSYRRSSGNPYNSKASLFSGKVRE
jgi:hypothetical protein